MLCKVTHCGGHFSTNNRSHQLYWGDQEMGLLSYAQNAVRWLALSILQVHTFLCTSIHRLSPHANKKSLNGAWEQGYKYQVSSWFQWSASAFLAGQMPALLLLMRTTQTVLLFTQAHPTIHLPTRSLLVF